MSHLVEELMEQCGVAVDQATLQRWAVKYSPLLEEALHRRKRPAWVSWSMDETYMRDSKSGTVSRIASCAYCSHLLMLAPHH